MSTISDMQEHCDECGAELELGQIGICDSCQAFHVNAEAQLEDEVEQGVPGSRP